MPRDAERIARTQAALVERRLDGVVATAPSNVLLLSGYWPVVGTSVALATRDGTVVVIAPEDEKELAEAGGADEVVLFAPASLNSLHTAADAVKEPFARVFRRLALDRGVVGCDGGEMFEPASYAGMHLYGACIFELLADSFSSGSPLAAGSFLARLGAVKTPIELERIRRSCRIAGEAFLEGAAQLTAGMRETDAAAGFQAPLATIGTGYEGVARAGGFVACMSGLHAGRAYGAYARSHATNIAVGQLVLVHCNSYADGYWTDLTRTFSLGPPGERSRAMYDAVFEARSAALDAVHPGARAADVDAAARRVLHARGFGEHFKHSTGHGAGFAAIDHNALPRLHPASPDIIETGMVFNIEPGIYFEEWGGMRHCDMVAAGAHGAEVLTPFLCSNGELMR